MASLPMIAFILCKDEEESIRKIIDLIINLDKQRIKREQEVLKLKNNRNDSKNQKTS